MKKVLITLGIGLVLLSGCNNSKNTGAQATTQNGQQTNFEQMMQNPENKLAREVMNITRIQNGDNKFTVDQAAKLTTVLTEIKAKDTIDETFATTKVTEITAVYTDAQKTAIQNDKGPGQGQGTPPDNNGGQQGTTPPDNNGGQQGTPPDDNGGQPNTQDQSQANSQSSNAEGDNAKTGERKAMDLKTSCEKALALLKTVQ